MKGNLIKKLIVVLVAIVMLIPVIYEMVIGSTLRTIKYEKLSELEAETQSSYGFGFAMVYVAPSSQKETKENKKTIKSGTAEIVTPATNEAVNIYYLDYDKLSTAEKQEIFGDKTEKEAYVFYVNGEVLTTLYGNVEINNLKTYINSYSGEEMSPNLVAYKSVADSKEFKSLIKRKNDVTMAIFGTKNCYYCNQFRAVYNQVALENDVDIYYFDTTTYNADEMKKIKASGLKIPKACTSTNRDEDFETYDYNTPLTLFIKNGKVIDCLDEYVGKKALIEKLSSENIAMIKDDSNEDSEKKD